MLDVRTGIECRVVAYDTKDKYTEYTPPKRSSLYTKDPNVVYIEAVPNERFQVEVIIHPLFKWVKHYSVEVDYKIDGDNIRRYNILKRPGKNEDQTVKDRFARFDHFDGNKWSECSLNFAKTEIADDNDYLTTEQEDEKIENVGSVQVRIRFGTAQIKKQSLKRRLEKMTVEEEKVEQSNEKSTKRVVKDNGRLFHAKPTAIRDLELKHVGPDTGASFTPTPEMGKEVKFTFYYTTREFLEIKNVVSCQEALADTMVVDDVDASAQVSTDTSPTTTAVPSKDIASSSLRKTLDGIKLEDSANTTAETPPGQTPVSQKRKRGSEDFDPHREDWSPASTPGKQRQEYDRRLLEVELEERRDEEEELEEGLKSLDPGNPDYGTKKIAWRGAKRQRREAEKELLKFKKASLV